MKSLSVLLLLLHVFLGIGCSSNVLPMQEENTVASSKPTETPHSPDTVFFKGSPLLEEEFEDNSRSWDESDSNDTYEKIEHGKYTIHFMSKTGITYSLVHSVVPTTNFILKTEVTKCDGKSGHAYGLVWGAKDTDNCYLLVLSDTGFYTYGKTERGLFISFKDWTKSEALESGNVKNVIALKRFGNSYELFFNEHFVCLLPAAPFFGDSIGFIVYPTLCVSIEKLSMFSFTVGDTLGNPAGSETVYETGEFDLLDLSGVRDFKPYFDYTALVSRLAYEGLTLKKTGDFEQASIHFKRAINVSNKLSEPNMDLLGSLYYEAGLAEYSLERFDNALGYFNRAFALCREKPGNPTCAGTAACIGKIHEAASRFNEAVSYYMKAIELADQGRLIEEQARYLRYTGDCYYKQADYKKTVDMYVIALKIDEERNDKKNIIDDLSILGKVTDILARHEESLAYAKKAVNAASDLKDYEKITVNSILAAGVDQKLELWSDAVDQYNFALTSTKALLPQDAVKTKAYSMECLLKIAHTYRMLGMYEQEASAYEKYITIADARIDENQSEVFDLLAAAYRDQGQFKKASDILEKKRDSAEKRKQFDALAFEYDQIGLLEQKTGAFENAIGAMKKSIEIASGLQNRSILKKTYIDIASIFSEWGYYGKAFEYMAKACALTPVSPDPFMEESCDRIAGDLCTEQGDNEKALVNYQKALDVARSSGNTEEESRCLLAIGESFRKQQRSSDAIKSFDQALTAARQIRKTDLQAAILNSSAAVRCELGNSAKGMENYNEALDLVKKTGNTNLQMRIDINIGFQLLNEKDYRRAQEYLSSGFVISESLQKHMESALITAAIGDIALNLGNFNKAIDDYNRSISILEKARPKAREHERWQYDSIIEENYERIISVQSANSSPSKALETREKSFSRNLDITFGKKQNANFINADFFKRKLPRDEAALVYSDVLDDSFSLLFVTAETVKKNRIAKTGFVKQISAKYGNRIRNAQAGFFQSHMNIPVFEKESPLIPARLLDHKNEFDAIITYYFHLLSLSHPDKQDDEERNEIGNALYELLIKPVENELSDKKKIVIIPDGSLCLLPFDSLTNRDSGYLVSRFTIGYTHSLGLFELCNKREYPDTRKQFIEYSEPVYKSHPKPADELSFFSVMRAMESDTHSLSSFYDYYISDKDELSNSFLKPADIKRIFPDANIRTGIKASKSDIVSQSDNGLLENYKIIQFAVRGEMISDIPILSYLRMSDTESKGVPENNFLGIRDIANLDLHTDLVYLSGCRAHLSDRHPGGGVINLCEAFLLAGANSIVSTLWDTDIESSASFSRELYGLINENKLSYIEAVTSIKRSFLQGKYSNPYYWARYYYFGK